jgi:hypothetical protein
MKKHCFSQRQFFHKSVFGSLKNAKKHNYIKSFIETTTSQRWYLRTKKHKKTLLQKQLYKGYIKNYTKTAQIMESYIESYT